MDMLRKDDDIDEDHNVVDLILDIYYWITAYRIDYTLLMKKRCVFVWMWITMKIKMMLRRIGGAGDRIIAFKEPLHFMNDHSPGFLGRRVGDGEQRDLKDIWLNYWRHMMITIII